MSFISVILIGSLLFILFNEREVVSCPTAFHYNSIGLGCYKVANGSHLTWAQARQACHNDSIIIAANTTGINGTIHLVSLENLMEKNSLFYWMKAFEIHEAMWTDGLLSASIWSWSNQSILWFFNETERAVVGNGSNYQIIYSQNTTSYQIADDPKKETLGYICEYQVQCNGTNECQNGATCYINIGQELCVCAPGFTGEKCDIDIDECLSSPCKHGGNCTDGSNNYTCDCSNILYDGPNCQTPKDDPTRNKRSSAFWSVIGIISGLVVLLTLSDLPWEDIVSTCGCSFQCFKCCQKKTNVEYINDNHVDISYSPTHDQNLQTNRTSISHLSTAPKGMNYHVMNTVWDPDYIHSPTSINPQYTSYHSSDKYKSPDSSNIKSFSTLVMIKQKQKELQDKRLDAATNRKNESTTKSTDSVDNMVNWTQQLQEQLRNKKGRETSASSTKQLIHSSNTNDY